MKRVRYLLEQMFNDSLINNHAVNEELRLMLEQEFKSRIGE